MALDREFEQRKDVAELNEFELELATGGSGSKSSGAGAGKVTFNQYSITRKVDRASPVFF